MKQRVAYILVFIIGGVIGASLMHHFGRCQMDRPFFRDSAFFEQHQAD